MELKPSAEMNKLKEITDPSRAASTMDAISKLESYQNIHYLLSVLAVMPLPTCDAERGISCLGIVKTYAYEKQHG